MQDDVFCSGDMRAYHTQIPEIFRQPYAGRDLKRPYAYNKLRAAYSARKKTGFYKKIARKTEKKEEFE